MSNDEQMAAIGRLVTQHADARKQLTLILGELQELGQRFTSIGHQLGRQDPPLRGENFGKLRTALSDHVATKYLNTEVLSEALSSVEDLQSKVVGYRSQLEALGVQASR